MNFNKGNGKGLQNFDFENISIQSKYIFESNLNTRNIYRLKFVLPENFWNWNMSFNFLLESDLNQMEAEIDNFRKLPFANDCEFFYIQSEIDSFAKKFGDWTIEKGDYILPPPERRFRKDRKYVLKQIRTKSIEMILVSMITSLIILFILNNIFNNY